MTREEVIELGTKLGLEYNEEKNYVEDEKKGEYVVFDGANAQRFNITFGIMTDDEVIRKLGDALRFKGQMEKKMQIAEILSITSN